MVKIVDSRGQGDDIFFVWCHSTLGCKMSRLWRLGVWVVRYMDVY